MKFLFSILMSLQIISGSTFIPEACRLPSLLSHFREHQQEEDISIVNFLHEHYCCENRNAHENQHEQLPLKHCPDCCHHSQNTFQYFTVIDNVDFSLQEKSIAVFSAQYNFRETHFSNTVWQPPRIA
jgi:hypothetical protein